jgi:hypothetical protein
MPAINIIMMIRYLHLKHCIISLITIILVISDQIAFASEDTKEASHKVLQGGVASFIQKSSEPTAGVDAYRQGWLALNQKNYNAAANYFNLAANQISNANGVNSYVAEARFAEAQCRRLTGQYDRAKQLYQLSIDLFQEYDPSSKYLKAAVEALRELSKEKPRRTFKALVPTPGIAKVDNNVVLSAKVTQLDTGVSINDFADGDFFNRTRGMLPKTAAVNLTEDYTKKTILKAFAKMNCLETTAVGANYYSATSAYRPIKAEGRPIAVGASNDLLCPVAELKLNGQMYKVAMDLPDMSTASKNVLLITDGRTVIAIDPRTSESWKLIANFAHKNPDFSWWKLGAKKKRK